MKRTILYGMMAMLIMAFMSVSFVSCSDDDDKKLEDFVNPDDDNPDDNPDEDNPDDDDFEDVIEPDPNDPALTGDHDPKLIGTWLSAKDEHGWHKYVFLQNGRYKSQDDYGDGNYIWHSGYWSTEDGWLYIYCTNTNYEPYLEDWGIGYEIDAEGNLISGQITYKRQ